MPIFPHKSNLLSEVFNVYIYSLQAIILCEDINVIKVSPRVVLCLNLFKSLCPFYCFPFFLKRLNLVSEHFHARSILTLFSFLASKACARCLLFFEGALIFKSQQLGSALIRSKGVGSRLGGVFKDVIGWGCAFVWPVYNLAHVNNSETQRLSVFDPHMQCRACRLGV